MKYNADIVYAVPKIKNKGAAPLQVRPLGMVLKPTATLASARETVDWHSR